LKTCTDKVRLALEDDYPAAGPRAVFLTDIFNPCWIFAAAPLGGARRIALDVGQVPFNFQVGKDVEGITFRPPATPDGEFEARAPGCDGERIAVLPLGPARGNPGVTRLVAPIASRAGNQDLCITYTATGVNPMWAVDGVELLTQ
jgi:hexosaminidase